MRDINWAKLKKRQVQPPFVPEYRVDAEEDEEYRDDFMPGETPLRPNPVSMKDIHLPKMENMQQLEDIPEDNEQGLPMIGGYLSYNKNKSV